MTTEQQIQVIAAEIGCTAEIVQLTDRAALFAAWDAEQAATDAELGASPFETRREMGV